MKGAELSPKSVEVRKHTGAVLQLKDGTRLVSDIYALVGAKPAPALLMRQPYGRAIASTVVYAQPEFFVREGFVVVIQDVRGRGDSEGYFNAFQDEAEDGIETVNWVASLKECDGRVCMYGFSYQGYTQLALLKNRPEALVAIAPHMSAANLYDGWFYKDGILRLSTTLSWGNQMLREDAWRQKNTKLALALEASWRAPSSLTSQLPVADAQPLCHAEAPGYLSKWLAHEQYDDYWQRLDTSECLEKTDIPIFHLAGYYDYYLDGSLSAYQFRKHCETDFFLLSPWKHIPWERWIAGHDLGPEARLDTDQLLANWFKTQLGLPTQSPVRPGVRYFTLGSNQWQTCDSWPPASERLTLFLSSKGRANSSAGDGKLMEGLSDDLEDTFVSDPQVPVLAPGGMVPVWGPVDLREQQQGNNMLLYTGEVFSEKTTISGQPSAEIYVSTDVPSLDLFARLSWVRQDGSALFISLAAAEISFDGTGPVRVALNFGACSLELKAGESLRLDLAGQAFPLFARNPQDGTSRLRKHYPCDFKIARVHIHHDPEWPSSLILPKVS
ncbi:MAG: CocE/NonD family hydrolase [Verrucomicrobia bacterium]|jgi:putative CocE/NonD family hydrolase|nr:CocE/NonD family hydrolase [Verrucomicrobiota bacterium]